MLIHDSFSSIGVTLAIVRELFTSGRWRYVGRSGSLTEYRREPLGGAGPGPQRRSSSCSSCPWFARNVLIKVLITVAPRPAHPPLRARPVGVALLGT